MEDLQINIYAVLGALELILLLLVVVLIYIIRSRNLTRRLQLLEKKLKQPAPRPETVTFEQYLREELNRNQELMECAVASEEDADKKTADVLRTREKYLELEVEVRALESDPDALRDKLLAGLNVLIDELHPAEENVTQTAVEKLEIVPQQDDVTLEQGHLEPRKLIDTHDAEFERLRNVINNQQDVLEAMRKAENVFSGQDDRQGLETKLQDLEALVDYKDAVIEELEKRCTELEARVPAAIGEQ